jgi:hypothetical protein
MFLFANYCSDVFESLSCWPYSGSFPNCTAYATTYVVILLNQIAAVVFKTSHKMKWNRSLNTTNRLLAKMELSYVTTCFGLHLWPSSGYNLVTLRVYTICLKHIVFTSRSPTDKNTKHAQMTYTCGHILRNNTNSTIANQREE